MKEKLNPSKIKSIDIRNDNPLFNNNTIVPGWEVPHCDFEPFGLNFTNIVESWCSRNEEFVVLGFEIPEESKEFRNPWIHFYPKELAIGKWNHLREDLAVETKELLLRHVEYVAAWYLHIAKRQLEKYDEHKVYLEVITSL